MSPAVRAFPPDASLISRLRSLDARVQAETGHEAFPESVWSVLEDPGRAALVGMDPDGSAATLVYRSDTFAPPHRQAAIGAVPGTEHGRIRATLDATLRAATGGGGTPRPVVAWIPGSDPGILEVLEAAGFRFDREQLQMRVSLPVCAAPRWPPEVTVRAFVPGRDDDVWLRVNNRAFENHPDQGAWIAGTLDRRMAEPWFDPEGFLLAWRGPELVGFCWTKVHEAPEHLGEIFVIGVDPDARALGLGRALVLAGLGFLARDRECTIGALYVAADNSAAVALYRSIGFRTARTDTALTGAATRTR